MDNQIDWDKNEDVLAVRKAYGESCHQQDTVSDIYLVFDILYSFSRVKKEFTLLNYFNAITPMFPEANITKERIAYIFYELSRTFFGTGEKDGKTFFWVAYSVKPPHSNS